MKVRVSRTGTKSFVYVFRRDGKLHRLTLGAVGGITLNDAHAMHSEVRKRTRAGESIPALRAYIGSELTSGDYTVKDLATEWMDRRVKLERKTWRNVDRGSPITANRCAAMVKQMFEFGVGQGIVGASPGAPGRIRR